MCSTDIMAGTFLQRSRHGTTYFFPRRVYGAVKNRTMDKGWWLILVLGLVSVAAGVLAIFYPGLTALALVLLMGANALVTGALEIAVAIRLRKTVRNEWLFGPGWSGVDHIRRTRAHLSGCRSARVGLARLLLRGIERRPAAFARVSRQGVGKQGQRGRGSSAGCTLKESAMDTHVNVSKGIPSSFCARPGTKSSPIRFAPTPRTRQT